MPDSVGWGVCLESDAVVVRLEMEEEISGLVRGLGYLGLAPAEIR